MQAQVAADECHSPIRGRDWGALVWDSTTESGARVGHFPSPPSIAANAVDELSGEFVMVVVSTTEATTQLSRDTIVRGRLSLHRTPAAYRHPPNRAIDFPFYGQSTLDLARLGPVSLAYSPADSSVERPGVQVSYNTETGSLDLDFGNAFTPHGTYTDSGVIFYVFHVDSAGFSGWWRDGGLLSPPTQGYFCASRLQ